MSRPDYRNWIPKWMITAGIIGIVLSLILLLTYAIILDGTARIIVTVLLALVLIFMCVYLVWCIFANNVFSYTGKRKLSKSIIDGIAEYIELVNTANGRFMSSKESKRMFLSGSKLLVGKK